MRNLTAAATHRSMLNLFKKTGRGKLHVSLPFPSQKYAGMSAYVARRDELRIELSSRNERENSVTRGIRRSKFKGHCALCDKSVIFSADWQHSLTLPDGRRVPNWRERLVCPCGINNRLRACLHFMLSECGFSSTSELYLTEQTTPFFKLAREISIHTVGSEHLSDGTGLGATNRHGLRNEDITKLTFDSDQFDIVGSFDVLEHVPEYKTALTELSRILRPGGSLVLTAPFRVNSKETLVRARVKDDGAIEHLLPPEYHGHLLNAEGVLCYYHFGWDLLDEMRSAGFSDVGCHVYWSYELGYLGDGTLLHAIK